MSNGPKKQNSKKKNPECRDYQKEYQDYHSKSEQKKNRAARNKANRNSNCGPGQEVDHKVPLSKGGGNSEKNWRVVSRKTNRTKYDKLAEAIVYHGTPQADIESFEPRVTHQDSHVDRMREPAVFATPDRKFALSMAGGPGTARSDEIEVGYKTTKGKRDFYIDELQPGALDKSYNQPAYIYSLPGESFGPAEGLMSSEVVSDKSVTPLSIERIHNILDALRADPSVRITGYDDVLAALEARNKADAAYSPKDGGAKLAEAIFEKTALSEKAYQAMKDTAAGGFQGMTPHEKDLFERTLARIEAK